MVCLTRIRHSAASCARAFGSVLLLMSLAGSSGAQESYPAVQVSAWAAGHGQAWDVAESPTFPLEVEIASGGGANTAWARATPGRLHASAACGTADQWDMSRASARFIENFYPVRPGLPNNSYGDFIFNFVLSGSMRIHATHFNSFAVVSVGASSMDDDDPAGMLEFGKLGAEACLYGLGAEVGGDNYPYNNIFANQDGSRKIYRTISNASGGYFSVDFQLPVRLVIKNFIVNQQPPANDWSSRITVEIGAFGTYGAISDFSATFELAAQNPILPDPADPRLPHDGWSFTSTSNEIALPPPLAVATATGSGQAVFHASEGVIADLLALDGSTLPAEGMPDDAVHGFFSLDIVDLQPGDGTVLTVVLPADLPAGTHWWYHVPDAGWSHLVCDGEEGDHVLELALVDGGAGDSGGLDGVINVVGGPSAADLPPAVFLTAFTARRRDPGVDLAWRAFGAEPVDFAMQARNGHLAWTVPIAGEGDGRFSARDENPALRLGGSVIYDLHHDGVLLASRHVDLGSLPAPAALVQVAPNPFNPQAQITFLVTAAQRVQIEIYDLAGRRIAVVADDLFSPGLHGTAWDGRDRAGRAVPSGSYLVRLQGEQRTETARVSLVR